MKTKAYQRLFTGCLLIPWALLCATSHAATFTVTNTLASGAGSLSNALAQANAGTGTNTIAFNILPLDGTVKTIFSSNSLPTITRAVVIDGYTQDPAHSHTNTLANADDAVLLIELNGIYRGGTEPGLQFGAGSSSSVVRGLVINNFPREAIEIVQNNSITNIIIEGNFIGTDPTGKIARGNERAGIVNGTLSLYSMANRVGGTTTGARNVISGNFGGGVAVSSSGGGGHNLIQGNFIGVDATGTNALGNGLHGARSFNSFDVIGGATASARNVISANGNYGVIIGNQNAIVRDVAVQGNFIGTDATGTKLLPNGAIGVYVQTSTNFLIGGATTVPGTPPGNLIAGSGQWGVLVQSGFGLRVQGNTITANQLDGVNIQSPGSRDTISSNSIFANGGLGINLAPGVNNSQTNPVITSAAVISGTALLSGILQGSANTVYHLEFFSNASCDGSGSGEGQVFLGDINLMSDGVGEIHFSQALPNLAGQANFTATATDTNGNTSVFSPCISVSGPCTILCSNMVVSTAPNLCGANVTFFPTTSGNCGAVNCSPASGSFFPKGTNTVTCTSATGTNCSFTIIVNDTVAPSIICPVNIVTNVSQVQTSAVVNFSVPATDNCGVAATNCTPASGSLFPVGTTIVTCTATDTSGNTNTCSFTVTVQHTNTPPIAQCRNVTTNANASCQANVPATDVDNGSFDVDGIITNRTLVPPGPYPKGTNAVTLTVVDNLGASNSCSASIIVVDAAGPAIICPANIVTNAPHGQTSVAVNYPLPSVSDNCSGPMTTNSTPASGSVFPLGVTTVTCTTTDAAGNTNSCSFTVTVNPTLATLTWSGSGANSFWTNAANWVGNIAPANGDALVFPVNVARLTNTNTVGGPTSLASITLSGSNYVIFSPPLTLVGGLTNTSPSFRTNRLEAAINLGADQVWRLASSVGTLTLASNLDLSTFHLTLTPMGTLEALGNITGAAGSQLVLDNPDLKLNGSANDVPDLIVISGSLIVDGVLSGGLTISLGGRLQGKGIVPAFNCAGRFQPGGPFAPGRLTVPSGAAVFTTDGHYEADLFGSTNPGIDYDQLKVSSPPSVSNATLDVTFGYSPAVGETFVIITNTGAAPFTTRFAGFPQGALYTNTGRIYGISYFGGDGNDVILTRVSSTLSVPSAIPLSSGNYSQDFNSLASSLAANANNWIDGFTLPGWFAAQSSSPFKISTYIASDGSDLTGALYSFGASASSDRALGSLASGTPGTIGFGLCFTNDTALSVSNFTVTYTGEQWRNGSTSVTNTLTFWYRVSASALTNPEPGTTTGWTQVTNLNFASPTVLAGGTSLNGNLATNRHTFSAVLVPGLVVSPGQNVFFRWLDTDDASFDDGMAVDNLTVAFLLSSPRITSISSSNGVARLTGLGEASITYGIEAASNLNAPIFWQRLGSNTANGSGVFSFTDTNAPSFPMRFYRVLSP